MANLLGEYKLKSKPILPQTAITQNLDFVLRYMGQETNCNSIHIDSTGIAYLIGLEGEEPKVIPAGTYRFKGTLSAFTGYVTGHFSFTSTWTKDGVVYTINCSAMLVDSHDSDGTKGYMRYQIDSSIPANSDFGDGSYSSTKYVYDGRDDTHWVEQSLQTIILTEDATVDAAFGSWFAANTDLYILAYSAEEGWLLPAIELRTLFVEKEQSVSDEFDNWLAINLWVKPTNMETIDFTVNGETFTAPKGVSWLVWSYGSLASAIFTFTLDDLVAYGQCIISYGEQDVNIHDLIIDGANYTIKPQIRIDIRTPTGVTANPLFAKRCMSGWVLYSNTIYTISLVCMPNHYAIPQKAIRLNDYVEYDLTADKLTISIGDIPDNFIGKDPLEIEIVTARKIYDKFVELTTVVDSEKGKIVELAPQYKVNIEGSYYLERDNSSVSTAATGYDSVPIYGLIAPISAMVGQLPSQGVSDGSVINVSLVLEPTGVDLNRVVIGNIIYIMDEWFLEYMNQELYPEDIIGQPIVVMDYDLNKIMNWYITQSAKDANLSVPEYIAKLEAEIGAPEGSDAYKNAIISEIEAAGYFIERYRYLTITTVDEEMASSINRVLKTYKTNVYKGSIQISLSSISALLWYAVGTNNRVIKNTFSYKPSREHLYTLYNGETLIQDDFVLSDTNEFTLTSSGESLDGRRLVVDTYVPPVDRYTPGTLYVSVQTCLAGDTLIEMADGSLKRIDQIQVGDEVKTVSGSERVVFSDSHAHKQKNKYTDYYFNDGTKLRIIKDHRVYSPKLRKFVHISTLNIGDEIVKNDGTKAALIDKKTVTGESIAHYTLFTENLNDYFANGVLCGNIFSNIRIGWIRKTLLKLYYKFVLRKELQRYGKF